MLAGARPTAADASPQAGRASLVSVRARLASLPRDSRDTLFLLLVIGWVILPQVGNLPLWCSALAGAVLAWRGWLAVASQAAARRLVGAGPAAWSPSAPPWRPTARCSGATPA